MLHAAGGARDAGVSLAAPRSAVNDYRLSFADANDVVVTVATDFSSPLHRASLNANQLAIGEGINAVQRAGGSESLAPFIARLVQGAPAGVTPFAVRGEMDTNYLDFAAGLDLLDRRGRVLRAVYARQFGSHTKTHALSVKVSVPF